MLLRNSCLAVAAAGLILSAACSKHAPVANTPKPVVNTPTENVSRPPTTQAKAAVNTPTPSRATNTPAPAKSTTMPAETRARLNDLLAKLEDALFDYDKATIRTDAQAALKDDITVVRNILKDYPNEKLVIEGHADERGSAEYNLALGERRAQAVREFLSGVGIPNTQLATISYGKEKPVCTDETEACWQRNRRAHLTTAQ